MPLVTKVCSLTADRFVGETVAHPLVEVAVGVGVGVGDEVEQSDV